MHFGRSMTNILLVVVLTTWAGFVLGAPKEHVNKSGKPTLTIAASGKKKSKSHAHKRRETKPKAAKSAGLKKDRQPNASRWQAPETAAKSSAKVGWTPKNSPKSRPQKTAKTAKVKRRTQPPHHTAAKTTPAKPKTPTVSITPPDTTVKNTASAAPAVPPPVPEPPAAPDQEQEQLKAKTPTKSMAAKPLKAPKRPPLADVDTSTEGAPESSSGSSFLMLLTFLVASAGTFVYFKRREELARVGRTQTPRSAPGASQSSASPKAAKAKTPRSRNESEATARKAAVTDEPSETALATESAPTDSTAEPCTFERFVEMQVALSCWIEKGGDSMASMHTYFSLTEAEWTRISAYWNQRYLADDELIRQFNNLAPDFRIKYGGTAA